MNLRPHLGTYASSLLPAHLAQLCMSLLLFNLWCCICLTGILTKCFLSRSRRERCFCNYHLPLQSSSVLFASRVGYQFNHTAGITTLRCFLTHSLPFLGFFRTVPVCWLPSQGSCSKSALQLPLAFQTSKLHSVESDSKNLSHNRNGKPPYQCPRAQAVTQRGHLLVEADPGHHPHQQL